MSVRYAILGVEGPTDQAVVGKVLKLLGFNRFGGESSAERLDPFWRPFIPAYPRSGDLYKRLDMPSIFYTASHSVAVYGGEGSSLGRQLSRTIEARDEFRDELDAFGVLADADKHDPAEVAAAYQKHFRGVFPSFPGEPGVVVGAQPRLGVFVLPNNTIKGVVEHLILECGSEVYRIHLDRAREFVTGFGEDDRKQARWGPFDEEKAVIAMVASVLKPGKTNTVSLVDNEWISEKTRHFPMVDALARFLLELLRTELTEGVVGSPVVATPEPDP